MDLSRYAQSQGRGLRTTLTQQLDLRWLRRRWPPRRRHLPLIETAKLNDVDPHAWLTDVLALLQDHPAKRVDELLPWSWNRLRHNKLAA